MIHSIVIGVLSGLLANILMEVVKRLFPEALPRPLRAVSWGWRTFFTAVLVLVVGSCALLLSGGESPPPPPVDPLAGPERLIHDEARFTQAKDIDALMGLYMPDAEVRSQSKTWSGHDAIRTRYEWIADNEEYTDLEHRVARKQLLSPGVADFVTSTEFHLKKRGENGQLVPVEVLFGDNPAGQHWVIVRDGATWKIRLLELSTGDRKSQPQAAKGSES